MASTAIPVRTTSKFPAIWCRPMRSAVRLNSAGRFAIGMDWQLDCGDTFAARHEHDPSERLLSAFPSKDTSGNDTLGMPYACAYWFRILDSLGTCTRCCPELFVWKMLCTLHNWRHRSEIRRQCRRTPGTNDAVIPLCSNHFDRCCPPGISHRPMVWSNCSIDVRAMQAMLSYLTTNSWNPNPANVGIANWKLVNRLQRKLYFSELTAIVGVLLYRNACELLLNVPLDGAGLQHEVVSISCFICAWFCVSAIIDTCNSERK